MKIVFMGTPQFAVAPLEAVFKSKHDLLAVVSQPDREVDKKGKLLKTATKVYAEEHGIKVFQFDKVSKDGIVDIKNLQPDVIITAAYGQLLSQEFIDIAKFGTLNIHASLLPKYRGSSPIQAAILNGDTETGVTIMQTELGMDTGDILISKSVKIDDKTNYAELSNTLSLLGAELALEALNLIELDKAKYVKQINDDASYTKKIVKTDGLINFNESSRSIIRKINAFSTWPTAFSFINGDLIKIYSAEEGRCDFKQNKVISGQIVESNEKSGFVVACGSGFLKIISLQAPGRKILSFSDFLRGYKLSVGDRFNEGK